MRQQLEELVPRVYRFALRLTGRADVAEDLAQEALLRAWRSRRQLRQPQAARVWLFRIVVNLWRDQQRRAASRPEQPILPGDAQTGLADCAEQRASAREDVQRALQAMDSLPPRQREVLYLHACEHLSIAEMSSVLAINTDAVKSSLSLARRRMREKLKNLFEDVPDQRAVP